MTVSAAVLTDLLSTAATPAAAAPPATPSQATQTPTPPSSTTATVPPLMCGPSERYASAAGPVETQQARTHPSRSTASTSESSDSSDEDVSVGTPPPRKHPYTTEDILSGHDLQQQPHHVNAQQDQQTGQEAREEEHRRFAPEKIK
ncbi:uncharacterized protein [Procambarus clarkii]|uniref:uncharacterized protein n=1 Tax=Procambarus clarkii TaxID=6728 RepID=UPI003743E754